MCKCCVDKCGDVECDLFVSRGIGWISDVIQGAIHYIRFCDSREPWIPGHARNDDLTEGCGAMLLSDI
jgi:hypothetical protein